MKNYIVYMFLVGIIVLSGCSNTRIQGSKSENIDSTTSNTTNHLKLETQVYRIIEDTLQKQYGSIVRDKKVEIISTSDDGMTAKGNRRAKDARPWIAYKIINGDWKILISIDGFDCDQLDVALQEMSTQQKKFIKDIVYNAEGGKICYKRNSE